MTKTCIIARFLSIDLPYLAQWFEHHDRLGTARYHLAYFDGIHADLEKVLSYFPKEKVSLKLLPKEICQMDLSAFFKPEITSEFVLHIDSDELLVLPEGKGIDDFLKSSGGADLFRFPWVMTSSDRPAHASLAAQSREVPSYRVPQHKSLARREALVGSMDTHDYVLAPGSWREGEPSGAYVQHFAHRGLVDTYLKCRDHGLTRNHGGDPEKLAHLMDPGTREITVAEIPKRLMAALGEVQCGNPREMVPLDPAPKSVTDRRLISAFLRPGEMETFARRWEDLLAANLFEGFSIEKFPKLEIWHHLESQQGRVIRLS
jgi:hypothetical protein